MSIARKKNRLIACLSQSLHEVETIHHSSGWLSLQLIAISSTNAISSIINDNHERVDESLFPELPDRLQLTSEPTKHSIEHRVLQLEEKALFSVLFCAISCEKSRFCSVLDRPVLLPLSFSHSYALCVTN